MLSQNTVDNDPYEMLPHFGTRNVFYAGAIVNSTTISTLNCAATSAGTSARTFTSDSLTGGRRVGLATSASNTAARVIGANAQFYRSTSLTTSGGFHFIGRFITTNVASNNRLFMGLYSSTTAPTSAEPSTLVNKIMIGADSTDTNLQLMTMNATTNTKVDLGIVKTTLALYEVRFYIKPAGSTLVYSLTNEGTGTITSGSTTTTLPALGVAMTPTVFIISSNASAQSIDFVQMYCESTS